LASVIIVLGGLIVIESLRRWYLLLAGGAPRESAEMAGEEIV